ncbi:MAG: diguanylate cyclase [Oscillospiraceae bacterium]|nr:diguanylate cyclase [Oscillospiraceae bacterium]
MKEKHTGETNAAVLKNLIITVVIILVFLGIILGYYVSLYNEMRNNIILNGEKNAIRASDQIDRYLYTGSYLVELTGYALDDLLRGGSPRAEIQAYLENQSFATSTILDQQSNGIYGLISGEYMDGANWVPDADYVPTERLWYRDAIASAGAVAITEPYLDAQTGNMIITFSKALYDKTSVVAIDVSLGHLQSLSESVTADGKSDVEIVLSRNYHVIAHSNRAELEKDYSTGGEGFGSALVTLLAEQGWRDGYSTLHYGSSEYIIYTIAVENNWLCVSVTDVTTAFSRLQLSLQLTILVSLLIIGILVLLMLRSNRTDRLAQKMTELAERQTEFAHYDQMTGLQNRRAYAEVIERLSKGVPEELCVVVFDINGLKKINDTCGHDAGDELIISAASCIRSVFHDCDAVYRIGGDEFCVILNPAPADLNQRLAQIETRAARWKGRFVNGFSIACGYATGRERHDIDVLVKEADRRMYENKNSYYRATSQQRRPAPETD